MKLRLMTDYDCYPLWEVRSTGVRNVAVEELDLSAELREQLRAWAKRYDAILDRNNPAASGFASEADELDFESTGRRLWKALSDELGPDVKVTYFSQTEKRELGD